MSASGGVGGLKDTRNLDSGRIIEEIIFVKG
jgi:hypothetical protein